ncbi:MAG TPA: uridine kinase [Candidatus Ornithospirochaeta avicola]|uniref:Uridine kinase n=1 Tax=Candidatus Ornithospirochaeta avicola TaxID=2840896 RepID=A0A9D1PTJ8_9SPIO|nr:uridine kinase [Candidatus Ornithospirochaeta avicola]
MKVRLIGITGGSGSGKSTVVRRIQENSGDCLLIEMDNYYKSAPQVNNDNITSYNFDQPDAFDMDLLLKNLDDLKSGRSTEMPLYDFVTHSRRKEIVILEPKKLIILDGLMVLYDERIRNLLDLKIYVETPADIRFIRRLKRDIVERGRTMESVIKQYMEVVRPGHYNFIEPTKEYADIIIPEGGYNENAMKVLFTFVSSILKED